MRISAGLSSLPTALGVTVDYIIDGQRIAGNTSCTAGVYNSACLPQLKAEDPNYKAVISYQVLPNATVDPAARVTLRACYSAPSATDRTWRKANEVIEVRGRLCTACLAPPQLLHGHFGRTCFGSALLNRLAEHIVTIKHCHSHQHAVLLQLDRLCSFAVKTGLPLTGGPVEWTPTELVPNAVYFVRAYAVCPNATYGTSQCGVGRSQGFFQINQINSRPNNLLGAVIGMCFAGPIIFLAYFGIDSFLTKRRGQQPHSTGQTYTAPDQMEEKVTTLT